MKLLQPQSGQYLYRLNGELAPVEEFWRMEALDGDARRVISGRRAGSIAIDVEAELRNGSILSFAAQWHEGGGRDVAVAYALQGRTLTVEHSDEGRVEVSETECDQSAHLMLFPLMRVFVGPVIEQLLPVAESGCVILPEIGVSPDAPELLQPRYSHRRAEFLQKEEAQDESGSLQSWRCCRYLGDQYDETASFWLAEDGLLQRYFWQQDEKKIWDVTLVRDQ